MRILGQRPLALTAALLLVAGTALGAVVAHRAFGRFDRTSYGVLLLCAAAVAGGALLLAPMAGESLLGNLSLIGRGVGAVVLALCGVFALAGREESMLLLVLGGLVAYGAGETLRIAALFVRSHRA